MLCVLSRVCVDPAVAGSRQTMRHSAVTALAELDGPPRERSYLRIDTAGWLPYRLRKYKAGRSLFHLCS
jgi:hypothetical protein